MEPTNIVFPDGRTLAELDRDELLDLIASQLEPGIKINFLGKDVARTIARRVRPRVTRTLAKYSVGSSQEQSRNLVVEAENLQAMSTFYRYRGQIDLILTDPPYNTGNDWRYNDKWEADPNDTGLGDWVGPDDDGRHTTWLKFMYPRIEMMWAMLKRTGILAICIDHRELYRLGQLLDERFDERNRLGIINWQKSYTTRGDSGHVATTTEYVLVYAKDIEAAKTRLLPRTDRITARYKTPDGDVRPWKSGHSGGPNPETHPSMVYGIQHPFTSQIIYPNERNCWRFGRGEMKRLLEEWGSKYTSKPLDDGLGEPGLVLEGSVTAARKRAEERLAEGSWPRLFFGSDGLGRPQVKFYLDEIRKGVVPATYWADEDLETILDVGSTSWDYEESGYTQQAVTELTDIIGKGHGFSTVKPVKLFSKIIQIWCPPNGIVLDPFAGSGTTGHAVLALNQSQDADRQFILVEQGRPDRGDSYARSILANRLSRVISGKWADGKGVALPGGFRFLELTKKVDANAVLMMERDEMLDTVIMSHFDSSRKRGQGLISISDQGYRYLIAKNSDNQGFFLVWDGPDKNIDFTEKVYEAISEEAAKAGLDHRYHVYARLYVFQTDTVIFYQIPDRILADFGLNILSEPFNEDAL